MADIELATLRKECITSLYLCADNVSKYLEKDKDAEFTRLRSYAEDYSLLEVQHNLAEEALETAKRDIDLSAIESIEDEWKNNLNMLMANRYKPGTHAYVLELDKKITKAWNQFRVAGCGNRDPIMENQLMSDEELRFRAALNKHSTMIQEHSIMDLDNTV
ncbi:hypothetical protein EVAR_37813_1 [Eumeta japonica]|uniref:Uncharacterized protein n=1 Tax=Eumeta variegata TaxID=151549 RepID=A0A4C1W8R6_EUMVA|nr:hypothetical protein EVAR_37813_1 [Eumeta japonica]